MSEINQKSIVESTATQVEIVGINIDETRRMSGSDSFYQVYFKLSGSPPQAWKDIFEREWKALHPDEPQLWREASIDREFLVMHCPLLEIGTTHFAVLKQAVATTNISYQQFIGEQAAEQGGREIVWKQERNAVEDMAKSLRFG